uniref:Uncharacterized protein n=1 Tax=Fagus sylvatica TaxID=28930 RepID=A0A2N9EFA6_FAGSY
MADLQIEKKKTGWVASPLPCLAAPRITTPRCASSAIRAHAHARARAHASYATRMGCGSDWSREGATPQPKPVTHRESTPCRPHYDPCKPTKNPQQTHCKQPP